jgi:hypothetical protein
MSTLSDRPARFPAKGREIKTWQVSALGGKNKFIQFTFLFLHIEVVQAFV